MRSGFGLRSGRRWNGKPTRLCRALGIKCLRVQTVCWPTCTGGHEGSSAGFICPARQYQRLREQIRRKVDRQITRLLQSLRHPGLYAKKMTGQADIWEARVDYHHRLTFQIQDDVIVLRAV